MDPILLTVIIASVIAILFIAVVVNEIIKKKKGKPSCSCGGSCGNCPVACASRIDGGKKD